MRIDVSAGYGKLIGSVPCFSWLKYTVFLDQVINKSSNLGKILNQDLVLNIHTYNFFCHYDIHKLKPVKNLENLKYIWVTSFKMTNINRNFNLGKAKLIFSFWQFFYFFFFKSTKMIYKFWMCFTKYHQIYKSNFQMLY